MTVLPYCLDNLRHVSAENAELAGAAMTTLDLKAVAKSMVRGGYADQDIARATGFSATKIAAIRMDVAHTDRQTPDDAA